MKTEYKILWIDDKHQPVRGDRKNIKSFLDNHGIELKVNEFKVTPDNIPTTSDQFFDAINDVELDMILIDFNMPEKGNKIIEYIRDIPLHYHLPILFYTSDADSRRTLQNSISTLNDKESSNLNIADGIYFCDRDHISEKAKKILTSLLKKEARPQQGRGLLMDRVSEIDAKLIEAIELLWNRVPSEKQKMVKSTIKKRMDSARDRTKEVADFIEQRTYKDTFNFLLKDVRRWDTNARAIILRKILNQLENKDKVASTLLEFYKQINGNPIPLNELRNDYAHKTSSKIEKDHNDERCKYIRTETRRQLDNLNNLLRGEEEE